MDEGNMLDIRDAYGKAIEAAEQLESEFGGGHRDSERVDYFASQCMMLLVNRFTLTAPVPVSTTGELDDE